MLLTYVWHATGSLPWFMFPTAVSVVGDMQTHLERSIGRLKGRHPKEVPEWGSRLRPSNREPRQKKKSIYPQRRAWQKTFGNHHPKKWRPVLLSFCWRGQRLRYLSWPRQPGWARWRSLPPAWSSWPTVASAHERASGWSVGHRGKGHI